VLGVCCVAGPSAIVAIVDRLETRGEVIRSPDSSNRRRMIITLTGEGTQLLAEAIRRAKELDQELFSQLPPELVEAFVAATRFPRS
jgi:DNA-binding MarR family transcriptional regulator